MKPLDDSVQHQNPVLDHMEGEAIWKGSRIYCCLVPHLCPTLCDPMDYIPPDSSVQGTFQARILEWVTISFSRGSSQPRDWTCIPCIGRQILCHWATREAQWDICRPVIQESWFFFFSFIFFFLIINFWTLLPPPSPYHPPGPSQRTSPKHPASESWFLSPLYFDWLCGLDKRFIEFQLPAKWRLFFYMSEGRQLEQMISWDLFPF